MATVSTTLQLLATLEDKVSPGLKGIGGSAADAEQKLGRMRAALDVQARSMALAQKELKGLQAQYAASAGRATDLSDKLSRLDTSTAKGAAAAKKLQTELDKVAASAQRTATAIERKEISIQKASNGMQRLAQDAQRAADALDKEAQAAETSSRSVTVLAKSHTEVGQDTSRTGAAVGDLTKNLLSLAAGYTGVSAVAGRAAEGFRLSAELDQSRRALGTLLGDIEKGDKVYADAIAWGQKYGFTQQEIAGSTSAAAGIIAKTNQTTEKTLEVLARLASMNPAEGIEGATFALKELASGDILSLVERFNISKDAAKALKDEIAAGADPVAALDAALSKLNVTSDVLANRMEGPNGALLRMKQASENANLALGNFLITAGAPQALEGLANALDLASAQMDRIAKGDAGGAQQAQALAQTAQTYEQYVAAIQAGDAAMLQSTASQQAWLSGFGPVGGVIGGIVGIQQQLVGETEILSEAQFNASQALQQYGYSAEQASAMVQGLGGAQTELAAITAALAGAEGMDAEAKGELIARTIELASASPEAATEIAGLIEQVVTGEMTTFEYADALAVMAAEQGGATGATIELANALLMKNDAATGATGALWDMNDATYQQEVASLNAAIAAEQQARFQDDLAYTAGLVASGSSNAAAAEAYLSQMYNLNANEVANLIALTNELNKARAGQQGNALARAAAQKATRITTGEGGAAGYDARRREWAGWQERQRSGGGKKAGGGKGKKAGKSEEEKDREREEKELKKIDDRIVKVRTDYQRKMEDLERAHTEKLQAIDEEYHQKNLEATKQFNADKFDTQLGFRQGLIELDQDFYDRAHAEEQAYWQESQALAQAGHAAQADALYAAGVELTDIRAQNAQEQRDLERQIAEEEDAEERARLETKLARMREMDAQEEQLARDKVEKIRTEGDKIEQERQEAIDQENKDYKAAQDSLKDDFAETLADIKTSYADMSDAARALADTFIQAAADATAAINSIPSAPGGQAVPVEARAIGGPIRRGFPYLVGEKGPELIVPSGAGRVIPADQTAVLRAGAMTSPLANVSAPAAAGRSSVSNTTNNGGPTTINIYPPANARPADIAAAVKAEIDKANRNIGGSAANRRKMGS